MAARFVGWDAASGVLTQLRSAFASGPDDVSVAPLGGDEESGSVFLIAGRFPDSDVVKVRSIVERGGGRIVADVEEQQTKPRGRSSVRATEQGR
ncbi:MAG: hypothetical protein ABIZ34_09015 [Candidatus Limnocylindrales bacterium]